MTEGYDTSSKKDAIREAARKASGTMKHLHARIEKAKDIEAAVAAFEAMVPAGCETFAPPTPTASWIQTCYFRNVRVVMAYDPTEGRYVMLADLYYREKRF